MLDLHNKKIAVLGLGIEGIAVAQYLDNLKIPFDILDRNSKEELLAKIENQEEKAKVECFLKDSNIKTNLGQEYLNNLIQYDLIFRSPGISFYNEKIQEAKRAGAEISSQIKLFFELCPCKIIGVTGTKGKGTTSSLIFEIIKAGQKSKNVFIAGNIGYPALTLLDKIKPDDYVILELSSFQLMDLNKSPFISVVTNLTVDHLDYHENIAEYHEAKKNILRFQDSSNYAVLNANSTFESGFINNLASNIQFFSSTLDDAEAIVKEEKVILNSASGQVEICNSSAIKLFGRHNLENIAAASLAAKILNIEDSIVKKIVREFKGLPHRIELVKEISGVKYINDSFATNPDPTSAAISSFVEDKILILGGSSKGADFSLLANKITNCNVKAVVLIGNEGKKIKKGLELSQYSGQILGVYFDFKMAITEARKLAKPGDVVLFSPACASFDMFKNYKDRGNQFKNIVTQLDTVNE